MSVMLYRHGGKHKIHNDNFDYIIVDEEEVSKAKSEGWYLTTPEAKKNSKVIEAKVSTKKTTKKASEE